MLFRSFYYGHSYSGNPLGCAAAIANLEIFNRENTLENLSPKIQILGKLLDGLREGKGAPVQVIPDVRSGRVRVVFHPRRRASGVPFPPPGKIPVPAALWGGEARAEGANDARGVKDRGCPWATSRQAHDLKDGQDSGLKPRRLLLQGFVIRPRGHD